MKISVITLTHNKLQVTRRCLTSLLDSVDADWELVVVDNGSTDGTREWLVGFESSAAKRGVKLKTVLNDGNIGCSTARNQGAAVADGELFVFIDNDVALRTREWLPRLVQALEDERAAGVCPKMVYPFPPYDIQCAGVGISPSGRVQFRGRGESRETPCFNERREMQCVISACVMLTRDAFEQAGGFDEAFNPVEFEDFDLCYRMREQGHRIMYEPGVEMYHFESVTTAGTASLPNTYLIIKNGLKFKVRWRHMFETEGGPDDADTKWRKLTLPEFESVASLPLID